MRKNVLLMVLLLATAGCACLSGVQAPHARGQQQPPEKRKAEFCPKEVCTVTVNVDKECRVTVDPYYLVMAGKGNMKITWKIEGGTFVRDSIRWKQPAAGEVFKLSKSSEKEVTFTNNRQIGLFNYGVTVTNGDKTCTELDPTGINDMP